ncbi:hypothetical protein D5H75_05505 [Bailinhaonella thermotolerans]|uniref:Secreted protein n=1 Tax=Bailinhaonella thermotolerans TaxID=1070861 RepID=A0A3A4B8G9_9ACTN|nr:hypothetical protein D5H75_05505 [Bailinhaonella thermotolerans]
MAARFTGSEVRGLAALLSAVGDAERGRLAASLREAGETGEARRVLIGHCAGRLLAGGDEASLVPFVRFWRETEPEAGEIPVADFVRLLPRADGFVAQLAVETLRRADAGGALGDDLFGEAVGALVFRLEKRLVAAALTWISDTMPRKAALPARGRVDAALDAVAAVLAQADPAHLDRAVRLALRLAPHAGERAREAVRAAAEELTGEPRERLAAAYGTGGPREDAGDGQRSDAGPRAREDGGPRAREDGGARAREDAAPAAGIAVRPLPALPAPIASPAELAAELTALGWDDPPARFERILAGLVELAHRDRPALAEALRPWWRRNWNDPFDAGTYVNSISGYDREIRSLLARCALAVVSPEDSRDLSAGFGERPGAWRRREEGPQAFVQERYREVIRMLEQGGSRPVLLAAPTEPTGHVDAETLVDRLERLGDAEPLPADLEQALLRLPREVAPETAGRAAALTSAAGRALAARLGHGPADPVVTCRVETMERTDRYHHLLRHKVREMHATVVPPGGVAGTPAALFTLAPEGTPYPGFSPDLAWWPGVMPSHREVAAAHLLECLPSCMEDTDGQTAALHALAHGDGPVGRATGAALVIGLGHRIPAQRAHAVDALLTLAARGQAPGEDPGWALAELVRADVVKLNRVTAALGGAVHAGAHAQVWAMLAAALPGLLPAQGEKARAGLADLLALASSAAALSGARGEVPALAAFASRRGSSRAAEAARALHRLLTA